MEVEGKMITGEFDESKQEFSIRRVKHLNTESTVNQQELDLLHDYLSQHISNGEQVISLNDQILLRLTKQEIAQIIQDIDRVRSLF